MKQRNAIVSNYYAFFYCRPNGPDSKYFLLILQSLAEGLKISFQLKNKVQQG
jgi:hypothetical protein